MLDLLVRLRGRYLAVDHELTDVEAADAEFVNRKRADTSTFDRDRTNSEPSNGQSTDGSCSECERPNRKRSNCRRAERLRVSRTHDRARRRGCGRFRALVSRLHFIHKSPRRDVSSGRGYSMFMTYEDGVGVVDAPPPYASHSDGDC
jgi:hypothetical protein